MAEREAVGIFISGALLALVLGRRFQALAFTQRFLQGAQAEDTGNIP